MTLWAPKSASPELRPPSAPELGMLASESGVPELEPVAPELEPEFGLEGAAPPLELDPHPAIPMSVDNAIAIPEGK
jgi:hypothetical protein